jgi:hypothetical protein
MPKLAAFLAAIIGFGGVAASPITRGGAAITFLAGAFRADPIYIGAFHTDSQRAVVTKDLPADFAVPEAMKALYGNYDAATKSSSFKLARGFPNTFFDKPGKVAASAFLAAGVTDSGATKVFLLTYAVPFRAPAFDCHACAPVIGVAVFAKKGAAWVVESANKAFSVLGNWGGPPNAEVLRIGPDRGAFELTPGNTDQGESFASVMILLPWKGAIRDVFDAQTEWPGQTDCGDGAGGCRDLSADVSFERGANADYDDIVVKISATETDAGGKDAEVHREQKWKFSDGKYVREGR